MFCTHRRHHRVCALAKRLARRAALFVLLFLATPAAAQHAHPSSASEGWHLDLTGQAFLSLNLQQRRFTDFHQIESQNWVMAMARHASERWTVSFHVMATAEPFTLRRLGSAQVFQSGESLDGLPLRDYQHPHDLLMGLGGRVERRLGAAAHVFVDAGPVGSPALGPTPFMHRSSANVHPTSPLTHHMLDSTHIARSVVTVGATASVWTMAVSGLHGTEPDEDRVRTELGRINSWAARVTRATETLRLQASAARLKNPEPLEPGDVTRLTVSAEQVRATRLAWTIAVGRNDHPDHDEWGLLGEVLLPVARTWSMYARGEIVDRYILVDFPATAASGRERHLLSRIGALTLGATRHLTTQGRHAVALGADVTMHHTPHNLRDSYGRPVSVHIFVRLTRR